MTDMETNDNINRLMEMIDNPEAYSEQEILDIINHDQETRETYRWLVTARRAGSHRHAATQPVDIDEVWRQFEQSHYPDGSRRSLWFRVTATALVVLMMSGLTWATVYSVRHFKSTDPSKPKIENTANPAQAQADAVEPRSGLADMTAVDNVEPVVFENVPLDSMLSEIAAHYGMTVEFRNQEARGLRFHFVWNKADGLAKALEDINHFESVDIRQDSDRLIVQ